MRAAKIDANQQAIVAALRKCGATVQSLAMVGSGCPDLLVGHQGKTVILELKDGSRPKSERQLTPDQIDWHINWRGGPCMVVNSVEEALASIGVVV